MHGLLNGMLSTPSVGNWAQKNRSQLITDAARQTFYVFRFDLFLLSSRFSDVVSEGDL